MQKKKKNKAAKKFILALSLVLVLEPFAAASGIGQTVVQAAGKVLYVNSSATGDNDGSSWEDAFKELQDALDSAAEGNEIWVAAGTYYPAEDISGNAVPDDLRTKTFQMKNEVEILGGFPSDDGTADLEDRNINENETILSGDLNKNNAIDGSDAYHVFYHPQGTFLNPTAVLDGVTITGGNADSYNVTDGNSGGGIFNNRSHPKLVNVTIEKNRAANSGGGVYSESSNMIIENGLISENSSTSGGGLSNVSGSPVLKNIVIEKNSSNYEGGGITSANGKITVSNGLITNNIASDSGGGIFISGEGQFDDVKILENKARNGAGLFIRSANIQMNNGEIARNIAGNDNSGNGGGIYDSYGWESSLNNVDIHHNAARTGGGIYTESSRTVYSNTNIRSNQAIHGAGVSIMSGSPRFVDTHITNNAAAENGGGVLNTTAQPSFINTGVNKNTAKKGAGIYSSEGTVTSLNSRFQGNEAVNDGGALYNYNSDLLFTNTLVSGNKAKNGGGFYENYANASKFTNVTIVGNTAAKGGALYNSASNPTIQNSIIWGNANPIYNSGSTPSFAYSLIENSGGSAVWDNSVGKDQGHNLDNDPGFISPKASVTAPTSEGDYRLASDSIAIDKGSNELVPEGTTADLDGNYRKMGTAVDLGAYENFVPDTDAPLWSGNGWVSGRSQDKNSIVLNWDLAKDNYRVKGYRIYLDNELIDEVEHPVSSDGNPLPFQGYYLASGLKPNTSYNFSIEAYDEAGNVSKRLKVQATTAREPDTEKPNWAADASLLIEEKLGYGIEVAWPAASDNQGVNQYVLSINGEDYRAYSSETEKGSLQGLKPDTEYEVSVTARDYQGNMSKPLTQKYKTQAIWQAGAESRIIEENKNAPLLTLPATESGLIREYEIVIDGKVVNVIREPNTSVYLYSLLPNTAYEISVRAVLYSGDKIDMQTLGHRTLPVWQPDAKLEFSEIQQSSILLKWPEIESGLAGNMEVLIDGQRWNFVSYDQQTEYIYNLVPDTQYEVIVRVYDREGTVLKELKEKVKTAPYSDLEPPYWNSGQELKATEIKETSMKLLWPKASDNEGIKGYRIFVDNEQVADVNSSKSDYLITGLTKGTTYTVMVQAYDEKENVAFIRLGVQTASSSGSGGGVIVLPPAPSVPQEPGKPTIPAPSQPEEPETPEEPNVPDLSLVDIKGHWAEKQIVEGIQKKMINGYLDNTFKPDNQINRAEFTILLDNALGLTGEGKELEFNDNKKIGSSARLAIKRALKAGVVNGFEDGTFRPNQKITRLEMAAMIARAMELKGDPKAHTGFSDDNSIPAWARGSIGAMKETGIISGRGNNKFEPAVNATRAETVVMLLRMMKYKEK